MNQKKTVNKVPIYKLNTSEEVLDYYQNWTGNNKFNTDMVDWNYTGPKNAVSLLKKYTNNKEIKILDAGCGSGLVGIELVRCGYSKIDGVDFAKCMIDLIPKDIYQNLSIADLNKKLVYKDNEYDVVICVGTFTYGHVWPNALNEFIRITKKNGLICFTVNEGIYEEYGFDKKIEKLSENQLWNIRELFKSDYITTKNVNAWLCLSEVS